ncbi:MAG: hypothetical protein HC871_04575 [Rhizobiales bacterium]|nr:hypothetical protein [Hyphomicrobiales bacterium]
MTVALLADPINRALLDRYQRDFPMVEHPFAVIGRALEIAEQDVIARFNSVSERTP